MFEVALGRRASGWQEKWARSIGETIGFFSFFLMVISLIITFLCVRKVVKVLNRFPIKVTSIGSSFVLTNGAQPPAVNLQLKKKNLSSILIEYILFCMRCL